MYFVLFKFVALAFPHNLAPTSKKLRKCLRIGYDVRLHLQIVE
jgi:hypothetical protein